MDKPITAHVVKSHDPEPPKLPPLPEAILFFAEPGASRWESTYGTKQKVDAFEKELKGAPRFAVRTYSFAQPTPPREPTDAEVAAIIREHHNYAADLSDDVILLRYNNVSACVRAALRKAGEK